MCSCIKSCSDVASFALVHTSQMEDCKENAVADASTQPYPIQLSNGATANDIGGPIAFERSSLSLPNTCLFRSLQLSMTKQTTSKLQILFRHLSRYTRVSRYFRRLVLDVASATLPQLGICFDNFRHDNLITLFSRYLPDLGIALKTTISDNLSSSGIRNFVVSLEAQRDHFFRSADADQPFVSVLCNSEFPNLRSLILTEVSISLVGQNLSKILPLLSSLSVDYPVPDAEHITFPQIKTLNTLVIKYRDPNQFKSIDVSCLRGVDKLCIFVESLLPECNGVLIGLVELIALKDLELHLIKPSSGLHPKATLTRLVIDRLSPLHLKVIMKNVKNFKHCSISFQNSVFHPLNWNFKSKVFEYVGPVQYLINTRLDHLDKVVLWVASQDIVDLRMYSRLSELLIMGHERFEKNVAITSPLYLKRLYLINVGIFTVLKILKACPLVMYLEIEYKTPVTYNIASMKNTTLNYLRHLRLVHVDGVFPQLPKLPRLTKLVLEGVPDFTFKNFNSHFPILSSVVLNEVPLDSKLLATNTSVKEMVITAAELTTRASLSRFVSLEHLTLHIVQAPMSVKVSLPCNLKTLSCHLAFHIIKSALRKCNLAAISGLLFVYITTDAMDYHNWLSDYCKSNPSMFCSAQVVPRRSLGAIMARLNPGVNQDDVD
ncbi:hypothetical protein RCL1_002807 [Eukaryota sp. TZLM3-RCL]